MLLVTRLDCNHLVIVTPEDFTTKMAANSGGALVCPVCGNFTYNIRPARWGET